MGVPSREGGRAGSVLSPSFVPPRLAAVAAAAPFRLRGRSLLSSPLSPLTRLPAPSAHQGTEAPPDFVDYPEFQNQLNGGEGASQWAEAPQRWDPASADALAADLGSRGTLLFYI